MPEISQLRHAFLLARVWLEDTYAGRTDNLPESGLPMAKLMNATYAGGWPMFITDNPELDSATVWLLMVRAYGMEATTEIFP